MRRNCVPSPLFVCILIALAILPLGTARAQTPDPCHGYAKCVVYDHATHLFTSPRQLELRDGEFFALVITSTAPQFFTYPLEGFKTKPPTEAARLVEELATVVIPIQHEKQYAGYRFSIRSVDNDVVTLDRAKTGLDRLTNTPQPQDILVETIQWYQSLAGAFTGSSLTDREFAVYSRTGDEGNELMFLDEDPGAEDDASLGLGAFIHLYHSTWDWTAFSFGLGLDSDQDPTYFLGASYRFGDKGAVTAGLAVGPVARQPNGVRLCSRNAAACDASLAVDGNVLNQLGNKTEVGAFVSLSYSFLDVADLFQKPFRQLSGDSAAAAPAANAGTSTPPLPGDDQPAADDDGDGVDGDQPAMGDDDETDDAGEDADAEDGS